MPDNNVDYMTLSDDEIAKLAALAASQKDQAPSPATDASPDVDTVMQKLRAAQSAPQDDMPVPPAPPADVPPVVAPAPAPVVAPASTPPVSNQYAAATAKVESGGNPNAQNSMSTARGLWQMLDGSYADTIRNHPELQGRDRSDKAVLDAYTADNGKMLAANLGRQPSDMELHIAHFLGATGATRFLTADPTTPVTTVVSKDAIAANPGAFVRPDGTPKTVAEVYSMIANKHGMSPDITASASASAPPAPATPTSIFPSASSVYGPQKSAIDAYIASQPQMFQQLQALQAKYQQQAAPTMLDKMGDAFNSFAQAHAAADANAHMSAGGVLLNANPNADSFIKAMQAGHQTDLQERQARIDLAKQGLDQSSNILQAQNQQGAQNLALTGGLAKEMADYGLQTGKFALEYGQNAAKAISEYIEKNVPNAETRAQILQQFSTVGNPNAALGANIAIVNGLISKAQAGGSQISAKEPAKMYDVVTPDANGVAQHQTVNAQTPEGQRLLQNLPPGARVTDLGAATTNVAVTNSPGGGAEGGPKHTSLSDQHLSAIQTAQSVKAANDLLDYLQAHGGTGVLTDSDQGKSLANAIKQVTGIDAKGISAREVFGKLMTQIQTQQAAPSMASMGPRPTGAEFARIMGGQLGPQATSAAARAYLEHVGKTADWMQRKIEAMSDAALKAKQANNLYFDPDNAQIQWQKQPGNQPPVWDNSALTAPPPAPPPKPTDTSVVDPHSGKHAVRNEAGQWEWVTN